MSDLLFKLWRINVLISKLNYAFLGYIGSHIFDDCRSPVTHASAKKDVSFTTEEKKVVFTTTVYLFGAEKSITEI